MLNLTAGLKFDAKKLEKDKQLLLSVKQNIKPSEFICISTQYASANSPEYDKITAQQESDYRQQHQLKLVDYDNGPVLKTFKELQKRYTCPQSLVQSILSQGWERPSFCQQCAIPAIVSGQDSICISATGSGKTGAYLIPLMIKALLDPNFTALIVLPTLELANQVRKINSDLSPSTASQIRIITPLDQVPLYYALVLDECDLLLVKFQQNIQALLQATTNTPTHLFSASLNSQVLYIASTFLINPTTLHIQRTNLPTFNVEHRFAFISNPLHRSFVLNQILLGQKPPVIVFCDEPEETALQLKLNISRSVISVKMSENVRKEQLNNFIQQKTWVLFTNDDLARGIDFKNVQMVVQYDPPKTYEDYMHRVGRAGRQGKGTGICFFESFQRKYIRSVIDALKLSGIEAIGYSEEAKIDVKAERAKKALDKKNKQKQKAQEDSDDDGLYEDVSDGEIKETKTKKKNRR
ncbi:ATP-dependent_RNA helicase [Hexamita inflata]|uniref:ATP-dependent RNA helicase n=1 Tax=Hexamita inflata TaxID=28002 RepID=A0AA86NY76_9EUKA|nr:ATP-dependent RNA helicase [Hexamita inflata]